MNDVSKQKVLRSREEEGGNDEWCEVEVTLRENDGKLELSICGTAGYILSSEDARKEAINYWAGYFADEPSERMELCDRVEKYMNDEEAAEYVIEQDGDFHGLDVHKEEGDRVFIATSCGQIRETMTEFFPEMKPYFKWHLNGMRSSEDGSRWEYDELPPEVIAWAQNFEEWAKPHPPADERSGHHDSCTGGDCNCDCAACCIKSRVDNSPKVVLASASNAAELLGVCCTKCGKPNEYITDPAYICYECRN